MHTVTGIARAKRRSGWMEIELDGASSLLLPEDRVRSLALREGDSIDASRLAELQAAAERAEAMAIALRYLSVRPRSRRELRDQFRRKGIGRDASDAAFDRCEELGYLDDVAFAAAFARDRIRLRPSGRQGMMRDLRSRGVSAEDARAGIDEALADERVGEAELLERAARKRVARLEGLDPDVAGRRLFAFLARRGFPAADSRAWMDAWRDERDGV